MGTLFQLVGGRLLVLMVLAALVGVGMAQEVAPTAYGATVTASGELDLDAFDFIPQIVGLMGLLIGGILLTVGLTLKRTTTKVVNTAALTR